MLNFSDFVKLDENHKMPVVSIYKDEVDLSKQETRNEINRSLAAELSRNYVNPYTAWVRVGKILSTYHVILPRVLFKDADEGEEIVAISQFGTKSGYAKDGSGVIIPPNATDSENEYYLYFSYTLGESGFYETYATVTDDAGLNELVDNDGDEEHLDYAGKKDPRQP
jgi:hypothetical protein